MKLKSIALMVIVSLITVGAVFAGGGSASSTSSSATISVGGSTSVTPLMELFQARYEASNNVRITISGTGSGDGITGAAAGTYDIGMSSRELRPAELAGLDVHVVAIDGIAVILNNSNPVSSLTTDQIKNIYTGAVTRWEQLGAAANGKTGGIAVVSREPGSGTRGAFQEILGFTDAELVTSAIQFDGTGAVRSSVAGNADAIGYISIGSLDPSVKPLSVAGVAPTVANVRAGTYTVTRPFILMTRSNVALSPAAQTFLNWTMGQEAQTIVNTSWISVN